MFGGMRDALYSHKESPRQFSIMEKTEIEDYMHRTLLQTTKHVKNSMFVNIMTLTGKVSGEN
jgi:hypothetical protein